MATFEDFLRPIPPRAPTGDASLDELLGRVEAAESPDALAALSARAGSGPAVARRLGEVASSIGNLGAASRAERPVYEAVYAAQHERLRLVGDLAAAAAALGMEEPLLGLFESHPDAGVRLGVGSALLAAKPSRAALERMAPAMDLADDLMVWVRDLGTAAAVRLDPATAYDRLRPRFERELALPHSYLARGLFHALHASAPIDPRWFAFLVRFYEKADAVVLDSVLCAHPDAAAVVALAGFVRDRARAGLDWLTYAGFTLLKWGPAGRAAAPAVVEAVQAALASGASDYRLTMPLDVLVAMDERAMVPALEALRPVAKRKAKTALEEALRKLGAEPAPAARKRAPAKVALGREGLASTLRAAGFSEARVAELVKIARPRIVIEPVDGPVGESRLGGLPDLPPGAPWPVVRLPKRTAAERLPQGLDATPHTVEGAHVVVPLGFVAQLRLEELASHDPDGRLPLKGLLSFFARQDVEAGEHGELVRIAAAVLFHEVGELAPREPPPELPESERRKARGVRFRGEIPLPEPQFAYKLGLLDEETTRYDALPREVPGYTSLGYAPAAYYQGLPERRETLLLSVGSDDYCWGDASSVFFLIADAALAARDFSKAVCVADEC